MDEATTTINKEKHEKEAAMEAAKAAEAKAAETNEGDAVRMEALHRQKVQRENKGANVNLTKSDEEDNGTEEEEDNDRLQKRCIQPIPHRGRRSKPTWHGRNQTTQRCCTLKQGAPKEQPLPKSSDTL